VFVRACPECHQVKPTWLNVNVPFQNHQVIRKMKPNKIGKRLSEKVLRNAHIGREQALPVPSNASLEKAMPVPYKCLFGSGP